MSGDRFILVRITFNHQPRGFFVFVFQIVPLFIRKLIVVNKSKRGTSVLKLEMAISRSSNWSKPIRLLRFAKIVFAGLTVHNWIRLIVFQSSIETQQTAAPFFFFFFFTHLMSRCSRSSVSNICRKELASLVRRGMGREHSSARTGYEARL